MKIVILAAGKGSRLGGGGLPKPLTPLSNGISILQYQINQLAKHFPLNGLHIVVGYGKELIMDTVPTASFIYNPNFAVENTAKSLLRAVNKIEEDLLWLNGDVVFHPDILKGIHSPKKNLMLVNRGPIGDEEVGYRTDGQGKITAVAKKLFQPEGESLGINYLNAGSVKIFRRHLENCQDNDYFEKGLESAIKEGVEIWSLPVSKEDCTEIDFPEDLQRANQLLKMWEFI